ncbi:hypothetical protein Z517_01765 [Fonsecaea pedrosoi CBS 271.37]|uniref:Xylanolytic transcriptional activator regulatory domain-containing protein n=1 Tax=Fonsecaea pedrosoi CBS 271.37 TaxID=1442368 RepID=A0A0D2HPI2_9EURO|nr:uncharacterized protein Z517_01765 [Fonsecaea pedrosoi CBS 271.37]KIW86369.1 hypothetical protein Z517_01765 [Fonsecaea pedrosoi CBS 271.37]
MVISPPESNSFVQVPSVSSLDNVHHHGEDDGTCPLPPEEHTSYEYHGHGSYLSICSKSAVDWVCQKTGNQRFEMAAQKLVRDLCRMLKLDPCDIRKAALAPEPDPDTAWTIVAAYFDDTVEGLHALVHRPEFEAHLKAHFSQLPLPPAEKEDPAWYALRNVIYAFGWRHLSQHTTSGSFCYTDGDGWKYFLNALSVHSQLLYCRTGLMAVQALVAMSMYVDGIGNPSLEYMLCVSSMKLAESKGLHREPAIAWNLDQSAIRTRAHLWWSIYIYERHTAFMSGRPLSIDDDDITCQLPTDQLGGNHADLDYFIGSITLAQISGRIWRMTKRLRRSTPTFQEIVDSISELDSALGDWYSSLPSSVKIDPASHSLPTDIHPYKALFLYCGYQARLILLHSMLVRPWNEVPALLGEYDKDRFRKHVWNSTEIVAEAARSIIRCLQHINVTRSSPKALVYEWPLVALSTLFIYVLQFPRLPTVAADIQHMDTVTGHLDYVGFASADLDFPFAREVTTLARLAVSRAARGDGFVTKEPLSQSHVAGQLDGPATQADESVRFDNAAPSDNHELFHTMDPDHEVWGALLQWPDGDDTSFGDVLGNPAIDIMSNSFM